MFNYHILLLCIVSLLIKVVSTTEREELLKLAPELWPGHLEPFGSKQKTIEVESIEYWPEPTDFFKNYVEKNVPVAFKGLAKRSPAYKLFTDDFLKSFEGADKAIITAETSKKEERKQAPLHISFKEFIDRYHNESLYMVNSLPQQLRKYVLMPASIRCEETRDLMSSQVTWFSSGGTKSVIHNDDVDNINCLYRGRKELFFVEYNKNKNFVPIDHPEGGYSSIDVDSVNYTKYPMLRNVDQYHHVTMEEGDCLFIPYHWFHQVNSVANENGQNLAINVWFTHKFNHRPVKCDLSPEEATLNKYEFGDERGSGGDGEEKGDEEQSSMVESLGGLLGMTKKKEASFKTFVKLLTMYPVLNPTSFKVQKMKNLPGEFIQSSRKIFELLDADKDGVLKTKDFELIEGKDEEEFATIEDTINPNIAILEDIFEDLVENAHQERLRNEQNDVTGADSKKDEL